MLGKIAEIAVEAGQKIMEIRHSAMASVSYKADESPVTAADLAANEHIVTQLEKLGVAPIVSEETSPDAQVGDVFWLVDPLDGTKDFIAGKDSFVVNIALVEKGTPILGVVYAPAFDELFWAEKGKGAFKGQAFGSGHPIVNSATSSRLRVLASGTEMTPRLKAFLDKIQMESLERYGSALKICRVSEGVGDMYPRFGPTSEWDTAAGHAIANECGCKIVEVVSGEELRYGKPGLRNPGFIACRRDLDFVEIVRVVREELGLSQKK